MRKFSLREAFLGALALSSVPAFLSGPVLAHHSYAMFDTSKTIVINGTVKTLQWTNPHVYAWLFVDNKKGGQDLWGVEFGGGPNGLAQKGWTKRTLNPGDKVAMKLHPLKDGRPGGMFMTVTLADGKVMGPGGNAGLK